jgi:hypothetical protein
MESWRSRFGKVLAAATQADDSDTGMLAGCYLLPGANQATTLAPAFHAELLRHQGTACWTADTLAQDAAQNRRVLLGYCLGFFAMAASVAGVLVMLAMR